MWTSPLMMFELLRFKTFCKLLGLIMKSPVKEHLETMQSLLLSWPHWSWSCSPIFTRCPTLLSSILEELNSYVILLQEPRLISMPLSSRPLGRPRLDQQHLHVFRFVVSSWRSYFLKVSIPHQMEKWWTFLIQYPWQLSKLARVTPLKHQRVNTYLLLQHLLMGQIHLCISRLSLLSPMSYSRLAISQNSLVLKLIGWVLCLKIFICSLPELKDLSTPPTIKFNCTSRPWRIS